MCAELPLCVKAPTIASRPSQADNEALFTSLSFTADSSGDKWNCVDTSAQTIGQRVRLLLTNRTKADRSANKAAPRPGPPT